MASSDNKTSTYHRPVELLQRLIQFDTTNPPGHTSECISFINKLLTKAGIETKVLAKSPERPNLIARLSGHGNAPPLLLYGHVDVVTTENQQWRHPPFDGKLVDGFVWGRGALDMKGGVAMMLAAFLRAKAEGLELPGDVIFAAVSDEEAGGDFGASFWSKSMQICLTVFATPSVSSADLLCMSEKGDSILSRLLKSKSVG